nr:hypothetical protein [Tanacetum cinerariifolium]
MLDTQEAISLPSVVLIGDMGAGKSSVLESLSGISLSHGVLFQTRIPLKIKLQNHDDHHVPQFLLEYLDEKITIVEESNICEAIKKATIEIGGEGRCIANIPLTLVVKHKGLPNVTLVELPGTARVLVGDQPKSIHKETNRKRTVAVVTKCDKDPDNVLAHVLITHDIVSYKFVRNQMNYETYLDAQAEKAKLFVTHPSLLNIANIMGMVGIPALADKLLDKLDDMIFKMLVRECEIIMERHNASI